MVGWFLDNCRPPTSAWWHITWFLRKAAASSLEHRSVCGFVRSVVAFWLAAPRTPPLWQRAFFLVNLFVLRRLLASVRSGVVKAFRYVPCVMPVKADVLAQLDTLLTKGQQLDDSFRMGDYGSYESSVPEAEHRAFVTAAKAAVRRITGEDSEYFASLPTVNDTERITVPGYSPTIIPAVRGALIALRDAVDS